MGAKMGNKSIALCSAALGILYAAGYLVTEPLAANTGLPPSVISSSAAASPKANAAPSLQQPNGKQALPKYQDGTYHGQGSNRFGTVEVAVSIKSGKISSVDITRSTTHYPQSRINGLPQQVIARQSAQIDAVTGATRSSEDFQMAIRDALVQAQQSNRS